MDNWDPGAVFIDGRYLSTETWYDADGKPFQPQVHYFVGGATKLYGAALYRLRPQDFGELHHVDGVSPAWPLDLRRLRALVHARPSGSTRCTATAARTRPRAIAPSPTRGRPSRTSRASSSSSTTSTKGGYHPFHAPCGILLDEADRAKSACIRCTWCDGYPCLVHAKADAETIAVRPILDLPNVTLLVDAEVVRLETDAGGRTVTGVVVPRGGDAGDLRRRHRRGVGRRVQHRQAAAGLGQRPPPQRAGQRLGPGRPELHVPQQQGGGRAVGGAQRHALPEDARPQRLLLRRPRLRLPDRQHPDGRQVQRRGHEGRGAARSPSWRRTGRWPTWPATPSTSGSPPRTCRCPRTG